MGDQWSAANAEMIDTARAKTKTGEIQLNRLNPRDSSASISRSADHLPKEKTTERANPKGRPNESASGKIKTKNSPKTTGDTDNARKINSLCLERLAKSKIAERAEQDNIVVNPNSLKMQKDSYHRVNNPTKKL